jgi:2-keto-4-pentenoate hydratase/2-oxohepta-3-ene-1,7-dioic acid hydratase in catechol pathway
VQSGDTLVTSHGRVFRSQWQEGPSTLLLVFRPTIKQRKIVAIGRNYADHVKELKNALPKEPFFFLKPTTSYLPSGGIIEIPRGISAHHEGMLSMRLLVPLLALALAVELGLVIGKGGRDISEANAEQHVAGYGMYSEPRFFGIQALILVSSRH